MIFIKLAFNFLSQNQELSITSVIKIEKGVSFSNFPKTFFIHISLGDWFPPCLHQSGTRWSQLYSLGSQFPHIPTPGTAHGKDSMNGSQLHKAEWGDKFQQRYGEHLLYARLCVQDFSHLIITTTPRGSHCYSHPTDDKTETQSMECIKPRGQERAEWGGTQASESVVTRSLYLLKHICNSFPFSPTPSAQTETPNFQQVIW